MIDLTTTTDDAARLGDLDAVLSGLVTAGNASGATDLFEQFAAAAEAQGVSIDDLKSKSCRSTRRLLLASTTRRATH